MSTLAGRTLSHYRVVEHLGGGGMGVVYKAEDVRLGRTVALKLLPPEWSRDPDARDRFLREARAVSVLDHPHICTVFDIDETADGQMFIVMAYYAGETLKKKIDAGPLPLADAVDLAIQIADGLDSAHREGIVHRDIKPANVMVTREGEARIVDFGIAKLAGATALTRTGTTIGTTFYMSPEQAKGEEVDHRTDLWSLGVLLYEMVAGVRPFRGDSADAVVHSILHEPPRTVAEYLPDAPPLLPQIIAKALEKDPEQRYASAAAMRADLGRLRDSMRAIELETASVARTAPSRPRRRLVTAAVAAAVALVGAASVTVWRGRQAPVEAQDVQLDEKRVVILPFQNLTGEATLDAQGLAAASLVADGLARTGALEPVLVDSPLDSAASAGRAGLVERPEALAELARAYGAATVVSGSIARAGDGLQLQGRVHDGASGILALSEGPVRVARAGLADSLSDFSKHMMAGVAWHLSHDWGVRSMARPPVWEAHLIYAALHTSTSLVENVDRVLDIDPDFAGARLALVPALINMNRPSEAEAVLDQVAARSGLLSPFGLELLGFWRERLAYNWPRALRIVRRMQELEPRVDLRSVIAHYAIRANHPAEALEAINELLEDRADETPPAPWYLHKSTALHMLGRYEEQLAVAHQCSGVFPDELFCRFEEASALAALGLTAELNRVLDRCLTYRDVPSNQSSIFVGYEETAAKVFEEATRELRVHGHVDASREVGQRLVELRRSRFRAGAPTTGERLNLANALCLTEQWDEAHQLYEQLLAECEVDQTKGAAGLRCTRFKGHLGIVAARRGDVGGALRISNELAQGDEAQLRRTRRWRLRIAALCGDRQRALDLMRERVASGAEWSRFHSDPDLEPLWDYPPFVELMRPKG